MHMRLGSLFSGIGGFDLGFQKAGYNISFCVEKDKYCQAILHKHFPNAEHYGDIVNVDVTKLPKIDVLVGGFPCQDISIAGKRAGLQGTRSSLFYEFDRYIRATNPRFIVVENVPGLLSSNSGHDFAFVLNEMVERWGAKSIAWRILDSQFFGVPQRRRRIFFVADLAGECASEILSLSDSSTGNTSKGPKAGKAVTCTPSGISGTCSSKWAKGTGGPAGDEHYNLIVYRWQNQKDGLVNDGTVATLRTSMGSSGFSEVNHPLVHAYSVSDKSKAQSMSVNEISVSNTLFSGNPRFHNEYSSVVIADAGMVRRLTPLECERLQGFPDNWTEGQSDSQRYKQIGNAVTVNVAEWIANRIKSVEMVSSTNMT
jgi:DNA (cytosine-5)-methyltransferase 1